MNFLKLPNDITLDMQLQKCYEEMCEFMCGAKCNDLENTIEEFFDTIQAMMGVLDILNIDETSISIGEQAHNWKLYYRGWEFKPEKLKFEDDGI